jgi:sugar/nucleoside kinase (ribokinase family)
LVIGSTVVDVILSVPELPKRGEDVNITAVEYRIGGCAYNVFMAMRLFNSPALLCSPIGSGFYLQTLKGKTVAAIALLSLTGSEASYPTTE